MNGGRAGDPMERMIEDALASAGIDYARENSPGNAIALDFYLPDYGVAIEVKRFHSDRIAARWRELPT